jgi:hypothetical protein
VAGAKPGVYGASFEVVVDVSRPLRSDEILNSLESGYASVAAGARDPASIVRAASSQMGGPSLGLSANPGQSDLKTVRYFVRQGNAVTPSAMDGTSLEPQTPAVGPTQVGGLLRQEIDRATRLGAEQLGDQATLETGQVLIAPEVVGLQFRYFDGTNLLDSWDMETMGGLPPAIEVILLIVDPEMLMSPEAKTGGPQALVSQAYEYRQTIFLPMARPPQTAGAAAAGGATGTTTTSGTSTVQ